MKALRIFTGSKETEDQLAKFLSLVERYDESVPISEWDEDEYMLEVMTEGRNGEGKRYEGSQALDDTGGFFLIEGGRVSLSLKALGCITLE